MRWKLLALLVVAAALVAPALALADDAPSPAATACKAEYQQLGPDAFKAKYGASEPYGNCLKAHGGSSTTTPTPPTAPKPEPPKPAPASGPAAACMAEYVQLGPDAFKAKYGANEPYGACLKAHAPATSGSGDTKPKTTPKPPDSTAVAGTIAQALCSAEGQSLGKDAFQAKYGQGKAGLAACAKAALAKSQSIAAACKSSTGADAFKQCVLAALKSARAR